jgi:hypothetical protein
MHGKQETKLPSLQSSQNLQNIIIKILRGVEGDKKKKNLQN